MEVKLHSFLTAPLKVCQSLNASEVLLQGKEAKITSKFEIEWAPQSYSTLWRKEISLKPSELKLAEGINHN
jgi:hypothetical protein